MLAGHCHCLWTCPLTSLAVMGGVVVDRVGLQQPKEASGSVVQFKSRATAGVQGAARCRGVGLPTGQNCIEGQERPWRPVKGHGRFLEGPQSGTTPKQPRPLHLPHSTFHLPLLPRPQCHYATMPRGPTVDGWVGTRPASVIAEMTMQGRVVCFWSSSGGGHSTLKH
jgi:hypothetical protein